MLDYKQQPWAEIQFTSKFLLQVRLCGSDAKKLLAMPVLRIKYLGKLGSKYQCYID